MSVCVTTAVAPVIAQEVVQEVAPTERVAPTDTTSRELPVAARLTMHADRLGTPISPTLYGLMTEEINHSYDGGLYAELLENRSFQNDPTIPVSWSLVANAGARGQLTLDREHAVGGNAPKYARLDITQVRRGTHVGMTNAGYWGIPVWPATTYRATVSLRAGLGLTGPITIAIVNTDGTVRASATIPRVSSAWHQYDMVLKTRDDAPISSTNRFVLSAEQTGTLWVRYLSLMGPTYHNRPNGNRVDLMEKLAALQPTFLRFPGGDYLENLSIPDRFDWLTTIGPVAERPGHPGRWGYRSSDGLGLLEFLEWCEDLHMEPLLALFDGFTLNGYLGGRIGVSQRLPPEGEELAPLLQEALDEIEYVVGDVHTKWGAQRAKDGHPAPFPLRYVEIGNEEGRGPEGGGNVTYNRRFAVFYDAIKAKYPKLQIVATSPIQSRTTDVVVDEHFYRSPDEMVAVAHQLDTMSRNGPKWIVGEWASRTRPAPISGQKALTSTLREALGDAVLLAGFERNSDFILMTAYAPLLSNVNEGASQWRPNLIGYDATRSFGSASYHVQRLFSQYRGHRVVSMDVVSSEPTATAPDTTPLATQLIATASRDTITGAILLKVVNGASHSRRVQLVINGISTLARHAMVEVVSGEPNAVNSLEHPDQIVPRHADIDDAGTQFLHVFPAYSVTVMVLTPQ